MEVELTSIVFWNVDCFSLASASSGEDLVNELDFFSALADVGFPSLLESALVFLRRDSFQESSLVSSIGEKRSVEFESHVIFGQIESSKRSKLSILSLV